MSDVRQLERDTCKVLGIGPQYLITSDGPPHWWSGPPAWGTNRDSLFVENPAVATDLVAFELVVDALSQQKCKVSFRLHESYERWLAKVTKPDGMWLEAFGETWREAVCRAVYNLLGDRDPE